jgi:hypothetical protein
MEMKKTNTTRLPVQHRTLPHCATCDRDLPSMDDVFLMMGTEKLKETVVLSITIVFRVKCACGSEWLLEKSAKA